MYNCVTQEENEYFCICAETARHTIDFIGQQRRFLRNDNGILYLANEGLRWTCACTVTRVLSALLCKQRPTARSNCSNSSACRSIDVNHRLPASQISVHYRTSFTYGEVISCFVISKLFNTYYNQQSYKQYLMTVRSNNR